MSSATLNTRCAPVIWSAFTDGIVEAMRANGEPFGDERLIETIAEKENLKATESDIDARVAEVAEKRNADPGQVYASLQKAGRIRELERSITEDKVFKWSQAEIEAGEPDVIVLSSPEVPKPVAVRYRTEAEMTAAREVAVDDLPDRPDGSTDVVVRLHPPVRRSGHVRRPAGGRCAHRGEPRAGTAGGALRPRRAPADQAVLARAAVGRSSGGRRGFPPPSRRRPPARAGRGR